MDLTDKIDSLIEQVSNLNCLNQIIETILVDDSTGSIESFKTIKDVDSIRHIKEDINYKLKTTRLLIKSNLLMDNTLVISDIDEETISNNSCIFECIAKNTNNIFAKEFFNLKKLEKHELSFFKQPFLKKIFLFGKYKDLNVWVNPDQKAQTIYFGKYDSLTLIINKNLKINDLKCFNDTYQLNKSISVEYLFIENLPISSLTLI